MSRLVKNAFTSLALLTAAATAQTDMYGTAILDTTNAQFQSITATAGVPFNIKFQWDYWNPVNASYRIRMTIAGQTLYVTTNQGSGYTGYSWWYNTIGMFTINAPGVYPVTFTLDDTNAIAESNESNNTFTGNITVAPAAPPTQPCGPFWTQVFSNGPSARTQHAMAYDINRGVTVLFGGSDSNSNVLNDTWEFDGISWTQRQPANPPSPRISHTMAYDFQRGRVILYGGNGPGPINPLTDTWEWDGTNWGQNNTPNPTRLGQQDQPLFMAMCPVVINGNVKLVMPCYREPSIAQYIGGTWLYDWPAWTPPLGITGPNPRGSYSMAFDGVRHRAVMFGGNRNTTYFNEIWEWPGTGNWIHPAPSLAPDRRNQTAMCSDDARGKLVVFGGYCGNTQPTVRNDTWEWDGATWTNTIPNNFPGSPPARYGHAMVFDWNRGETIMFGGNLNGMGFGADTWRYTNAQAPTIFTQPQGVTQMAGQQLTLKVTALGSVNNTYQWFRNGLPLSNGGRIAGANWDTLTIDSATATDGGTFSVDITNPCGSVSSDPAVVTIQGSTAPGPFALLAPTNGAQNLTRNVHFDWADSANATNYTFILSASPSLSNPIYNVPLNTSEYTVNSLSCGGTYYWGVQAFNQGTQTNSNPVASSFTIGGQTPAAFALLSPANGATNVPMGNIRFDWADSASATSYTFTLADDPAITHILLSATTSQSEYTTPITTGRTYYWRATALNDCGATIGNPIASSFTVISPPPGSFDLVSPTFDQFGISRTPTLAWNAASGARSYTVTVDENDDFQAPFVVATLSATQYTLTQTLHYGTRYYWKVVANSPGGQTQAQPATDSFVTDNIIAFYEDFSDDSPGWTATANTGELVAQPMCCDPWGGRYWYTLNIWYGTAGQTVYHWPNGYPNSPYMQRGDINGALDTIDFSFDAKCLSNPIVLGLSILQNGNTYFSGIHYSGTTWSTLTSNGLRAQNFQKLSGAGPAFPDFSASAPPLYFGFIKANGSCSGCTSTTRQQNDSAQDNWRVTLHTILPDPLPSLCPPCPADFNQDGGVDGSDVGAFFDDWSNGAACADVNQDGGIDGSDVGAFFDAWQNGAC